VILLMLTLACGGDESKDTGTLSDDPPVDGVCADAPVLTWNNFGAGFLVENCKACHGTNSAYREGDSPPPEGVVFDTYEQAMGHKERILAVATGDSPTMPPRGGVSDLDRELLELWIVCGEGD